MRIKRVSEMTPEDRANLRYRELTPEELAEVYRLSRESFTAADLQQYAELDQGFPAEEFLAELDAAVQQHANDQPKAPKQP